MSYNGELFFEAMIARVKRMFANESSFSDVSMYLVTLVYERKFSAADEFKHN